MPSIFLLMKDIIWNASGVGNSPTVRRLKYLVKTYCPLMVVVMEPLVHVGRGERIKACLGFDKFVTNDDVVAKISVFSRDSI